MAFGWLIRHQKKVLFVLAVALIIGWGLQRALTSLLGPGPQGGAEVWGRIAGEDVTELEFRSFLGSWGRVFRSEFDGYTIRLRYPGDNVTVDDLAWAYLGLYKLARQTGEGVSDRAVLETKRYLYQSSRGPGARLDETAEKWFIEQMRMTGQQVDQVLRQRLMAESMFGQLLLALEPTDEEAWKQYSAENRAVRVQYVEFLRDSFLDKVQEPSEKEVKEYYEARKGRGRRYFNPAAVRIEYAAIALDKLKANITTTVEELKKYYEDNKDLYLIKEKAGEGTEAEYLPFLEVKPQIEAVLKRRRASEKAVQILESLRTAYKDTVGAQLEAMVKVRKDEEVEYSQTPFLTEVELLEVPGIGIARADGKGLAQLAMEADPKEKGLSPVMASSEGRFVFRVIGEPKEASVPELAEVKEQVISDIKKDEALGKAREAAQTFIDELNEAGGADKFEEFAKRRKLAVKETPMFVNNVYDTSRPDFIDRMSPLELGEVHGPMSSVRDGVSAVVKVVQEREAERAGFDGERKLKRDYVLAMKVTEFRRAVFPKTVLEFTGYEDLRPRRKPSEEAEEGAEPSTDSDNE